MTRFPLPDGFAVRLADRTRRADGNRLLIGGSPLRALRLSGTAAQAIQDQRVVVRDRTTRLVAERLLDADLAVPEFAPAAASEPGEITVVIPVRDRCDELERALSVLRPAVGCLVVDDASLDPQHVARVAARHGAEVVALERNVGPGGARNAGLARVTTPLVAFVDSDVVADARVLLRLGAHFADPQLALVAPQVKGRSIAAHPAWFERYDELASSLDLGGRASAVRPGGAVGWLPSACLVGRVPALRAAGGFDPRLRLGEDVDLVWRLVAAGWGVRYDPALVVHHQTRSSIRGWLGRKYAYGTGGAALAHRHGNHVAPAVYSPVQAAASLALLGPWRPAVAAAAAAYGYSAWTLSRRLPASPARPRLALALAGQGLGWSVRQGAALLVRHWWPLAAAGSFISPRVRRAVAVAAAGDAIVSYFPRRDQIPFWVHALGRRLDDLAYGAGLWAGAIRHRSLRALLPRGRALSTAESQGPVAPQAPDVTSTSP